MNPYAMEEILSTLLGVFLVGGIGLFVYARAVHKSVTQVLKDLVDGARKVFG
jgi:hypothetical protein